MTPISGIVETEILHKTYVTFDSVYLKTAVLGEKDKGIK